jgi:hypothetical protein
MAKALQKLGAKLDKKETQLSRQESFVHAEKWINDFGIPLVRAFPVCACVHVCHVVCCVC